MSNSLWSRGLQHARLCCPSVCPGVCSNSCPSSRWCHPAISSSVTPFSSCPLSFPASRSFPVSQLFTSGGQNIGASASTISSSNEYSGLISFRIDWFDLLAMQGTLKSLLYKSLWKHLLWKQPRCPLADKWVIKLWYIYTMEYYSAIKKNAFESVLMRWMKPEPIIQSKSERETPIQYINAYMWNLERW